MATHARIGLVTDGVVRSVYTHWDGHPRNMLPRLAAYTTPEQVNALLDLGDLSAVGSTLETCVAYARDRGEDLNPAELLSVDETRNLCLAQYCGYLYLFGQEGWVECWESAAPTSL